VHVNQQLRQKVKGRLFHVPGLALLDANHAEGLDDVELPAALIATGTDSVEPLSKRWSGERGTEKRLVSLEVAVIARGDTVDLDDHLDSLRAAIEAELLKDDSRLGGFAQDLTHLGGELEMGSESDGEHWYAILTLRWSVEIWTEEGNPEVAL
jgi:hypothetical protein